MSVTRWASSFGAAWYVPWALPMAGANTSTPVARTKSTTVSSDWTCSASSPVISSVRLKPSISPSTRAPYRLASSTTSMHWRWFSSTDSLLASNRTEFQPLARQAEITARSGQWSRCSATGTETRPAYAVHIAYMASMPVIWTCLTDVWTMSGRLQLLGGGEDGLHGQVVDDVDGGHAVATARRPGRGSPGWATMGIGLPRSGRSWWRGPATRRRRRGRGRRRALAGSTISTSMTPERSVPRIAMGFSGSLATAMTVSMPAQLLERERDEPVAVGRGDGLAVRVDVVAREVPDRSALAQDRDL